MRHFPSASLLAALLLAASPGLAAAEGWETYVNERFGTTADVPAGWTPGEPPANGDGLTFTAPDGSASVSVSGSLQAFETVAESVAILESANEGETITYRHVEPGLVVVSGLAGDRIFYRKSILSCGDTIWNTVALDYPKVDKQSFDPIVAHVAASLRAGPGWQAEDCDGSGAPSSTGGQSSDTPQ